MEYGPYIVFAIVVALFVTLVWRLRAPRSGDARDAAEVDLLQRENDRAVTGVADLNDEVRFRRLRAGEEARRPPPRR